MCISFLAYGLASSQQVHLATKYNSPLQSGNHQDSVLNGLKSIRGCWFDTDMDGDGKSEIIVTNYADQGHVHVFETVGNDSIKLVWSSPSVGPNGGSSTPRYVIVGDLDNDGRKEIIYQSSLNGIYIFEWDGVVGSDNYGTQPSQIISAIGYLSGTAGNLEYMETGDVDGDGANELLVAFNGSSNNDGYYIISAVGDWSTNDPGFSGFTVEYSKSKLELSSKYGGGTPYAMIAANLDGTGNKEILIHSWNYKNIFPMRVTGPDTYVLSDTTNDKAHYYIGGVGGIGVYDDVALFGGMAYDIDHDGRDEVYLPTYPAANSFNAGTISMISYDQGQSTTEIDSTKVTPLDLSTAMGGLRTSIFGYGWGDVDGNGKPNLYFSTVYPYNIMSLEFQGGDKKNPANWVPSVLYRGDSTIYGDVLDASGNFVSAAFVYKDSSGVKDSTKHIDPSFVSKFFARGTDFDKDGYQDIILPYQALQDTLTIDSLTWNGSQFVTVRNKVVNPKRWGLRVIERTLGTGVEEKDLTIITPEDYRLDQNYPNPFNPSTTIRFSLPITDRISLRVYDINGREVRTLIDNEQRPAGTGEVVWNGKSNRGVPVASGTYFYTLRFGNFQKTNKMIILK